MTERLTLTDAVDALKGLYGLLQLRNASDPGWESNHRAVDARRVMALAEAHGTARLPETGRIEVEEQWGRQQRIELLELALEQYAMRPGADGEIARIALKGATPLSASGHPFDFRGYTTTNTSAAEPVSTIQPSLDRELLQEAFDLFGEDAEAQETGTDAWAWKERAHWHLQGLCPRPFPEDDGTQKDCNAKGHCGCVYNTRSATGERSNGG